MNNTLSFVVRGKYALFTDPASKTGGDKSSYPVPTEKNVGRKHARVLQLSRGRCVSGGSAVRVEHDAFGRKVCEGSD